MSSRNRANLFQRSKFYFNFKRKRFVDALASLPPNIWPITGGELWAAYRLGMYQTVAEAEWDGNHIHGGIAAAASLAACGYRQKAQEIVQKLLCDDKIIPHLRVLIVAIGPYLPETALSLLEKKRGNLELPFALQLSLFLKTGERQLAYDLLQKHAGSSDGLFSLAENEPELLLLANNILLDSAEQQEARLNLFLLRQNLSPVSLIDRARYLAIDNVRSTTVAGSCQGPLISVLMTSYNAEKYIKTALRGLLDQTYRNIEIIVVDDASTDRTPEAVEMVARQDNRVRLIRRKVNEGTYVAKIAGFQYTRGEFVTCHDSDDWSHPERLAQQVEPLLANPKLIATTSKWVRLQHDGRYYARLVSPLVRLNPASPLFRREAVVQKMGLWDTARTGADSEFHARLKLVFGERAIRRLPLLLTLGCHRDDSLMNAIETSYDHEDGAQNRLVYWDKWSRAHIRWVREGRCGNQPFRFSL